LNISHISFKFISGLDIFVAGGVTPNWLAIGQALLYIESILKTLMSGSPPDWPQQQIPMAVTASRV